MVLTSCFHCSESSHNTLYSERQSCHPKIVRLSALKIWRWKLQLFLWRQSLEIKWVKAVRNQYLTYYNNYFLTYKIKKYCCANLKLAKLNACTQYNFWGCTIEIFKFVIFRISHKEEYLFLQKIRVEQYGNQIFK